LADIAKIAWLADTDDRFVDDEAADLLKEVGTAKDRIAGATEIGVRLSRPKSPQMGRLVGIAGATVEGVSTIGAYAQRIAAITVPFVPAKTKAIQARIETIFGPSQRTGLEIVVFESALVIKHRTVIAGKYH
jgi:hypothetical protein